MNTSHLSLDSELSDSSVAGLGDFLGGLEGLLVGGQSSADGAGLLEAKVDWLLLVVSVELAELLLLGLVDDGQDSGDVLTNDADLGELGGGSSGDLGDAEGGELGLLLVEGLLKSIPLLSAESLGLQLGHDCSRSEEHTF